MRNVLAKLPYIVDLGMRLNSSRVFALAGRPVSMQVLVESSFPMAVVMTLETLCLAILPAVTIWTTHHPHTRHLTVHAVSATLLNVAAWRYTSGVRHSVGGVVDPCSAGCCANTPALYSC